MPVAVLALLAARAAGKVIIDGVYNDVKNEEGFAAEARQGREMGFDGKTLIHPQPGRAGQRGVRAERGRRRARQAEVIEAYEEAQAEGRASSPFNGRMIEELHVRDAQRILAFAEAITVPLNAERRVATRGSPPVRPPGSGLTQRLARSPKSSAWILS